MSQNDYKRLIISDLHIGSFNSKEKQIYNLLTSLDYDELILAGDVIDFIKVPKFTEYSAKLFDFVSKLNKPVIYIVGNHDCGFHKFANKNVGNIKFVKEYCFEYRGRKFKVQHGDQYETGIIHWSFSITIISIIQDFFERILKVNFAALWMRFFKKRHELKRIWNIIEWNSDADVFIMGHTHNPEAVIWVNKEGIIKTYINTGDWIEHSTYVILENGEARLKSYSEKINFPPQNT